MLKNLASILNSYKHKHTQTTNSPQRAARQAAMKDMIHTDTDKQQQQQQQQNIKIKNTDSKKTDTDINATVCIQQTNILL